jgi:hypothetical protein
MDVRTPLAARGIAFQKKIMNFPMENTMNRRHILSLSVSTALGLALISGAAFAQQKTLKEQLVGSWLPVSVSSTDKDGKKHMPFGPNAKGILVFDASGQYVQMIVNPDVPKFKINNRLEGTAEENKAAVHGTTATFGTWTVDDGGKSVTVRNVGGMFPNQAGTEGKRTLTVTGDELKITNPTTATAMRADNVWKRAK